jgi:hypothetical protein
MVGRRVVPESLLKVLDIGELKVQADGAPGGWIVRIDSI